MKYFHSLDFKFILILRSRIVNAIFCLLLIFLVVPIIAQDKPEKITYQQETGFFEEQEFVSAQDFVFQTFEETKSLFKLDLTGTILHLPSFSLLRYGFRSSPALDYEKKIGKAFSINNSLMFSFDFDKWLDWSEKSTIEIGLGVQPRWYYNMKKRIANNQTANNLSGNYIGAGIEFNYTHGNVNSFGEYKYKNTTFSLKFGIQRRIFGKGFIDIQIGPNFSILDYSNTHYATSPEWPSFVIVNDDSRYFWFSSQVKLGIALNQSRLSLDAAQRCDIFQCFEERKSMFKIDFLNSLNMDNRYSQSISGSIILGYEHKIGSYWSINNEVVLAYNYSKNTPDIYPILENPRDTLSDGTLIRIEFHTASFTKSFRLNFNLSLKTQVRYYYNLRKRIASGKSANNLSGNYFGLEVSTSDLVNYLTYSSSSERKLKKLYGPFTLTFSPIWGIQRTIFKRGYIDYTLGLRLLSGDIFRKYDWPQPRPALISPDGFHFSPFSRLRIGLVF